MTQTEQNAPAAPNQDETETLLRGEIQALQKRLNDRFREIASLTGLLEAAQERAGDSLDSLKLRIRELESRIRSMELRHRIELQLQRIGLRIWTDGPGEGVPSTQRQIEALQDAALFDDDWYLTTYPDLAGAEVTPKEHYVRAGAFEGRDPGPKFDTMAYYMANPDVVPPGWPALVHYLMFGRDEGRALAPAPDPAPEPPPASSD